MVEQLTQLVRRLSHDLDSDQGPVNSAHSQILHHCLLEAILVLGEGFQEGDMLIKQ